MKRYSLPLALLSSLLLLPFAVLAQQGDPLAELLVPPHLMMEKADEVGLSADQRQQIQQAAQQVHHPMTEKQEPLKAALAALAAELAKEDLDAEAARRKLDAVLEAERPLKQLQLGVLVETNKVLTVDQRRKLQHMLSARQNGGGGDKSNLEQRLHAKLERVKRGLEAKLQAGEQPLEIPNKMQGFPVLMEQGRHAEAEQLLDEVLQMLGVDAHDATPAKPAPPKASAPNPKSASAPATPPPHPTSLKSTKQLEAEIAAMKVDEVAWRRITWRICLLDALRESHAENKPLLLWVFIDRPVDDKRC